MSQDQLPKLQRLVNIQFVLIIFLTLSVGWLLWNAPESASTAEVIHAKGLVLHDEAGNPRLSLGFPISMEGRDRSDTLSGIVMLDESGMDRVHLGPHGQLFLGGKYHDRLNDGYSLFFNDSKGEERSGYGFSDDDNSVGLGMDYGGEFGGEAIYLYAAPDIAFMTINADLQQEKGIRDRIVLWHETDKDLSLMKLSDSEADGRILLQAVGGRKSKISVKDSTNRTIDVSSRAGINP